MTHLHIGITTNVARTAQHSAQHSAQPRQTGTALRAKVQANAAARRAQAALTFAAFAVAGAAMPALAYVAG